MCDLADTGHPLMCHSLFSVSERIGLATICRICISRLESHCQRADLPNGQCLLFPLGSPIAITLANPLDTPGGPDKASGHQQGGGYVDEIMCPLQSDPTQMPFV